MADQPDEHLFSEDFDLDDFEEPSLSSLFRDRVPSDAPVPVSPDGLIDLDDEPDARPTATFGTLADDVDDGGGKPLLSDQSVFEPLSREELQDDAGVPPVPSRQPPRAAGGPVVDLGYPEDQPMSMRDRLSIARDELGTDAPAASADDEKAPRKMSMRDRVKIARGQASGDTVAPAPDPAPDAQPDKPAKMSMRDRVKIARGQASGDAVAPDPAPDAELQKPAKMSMRDRVAIARGKPLDGDAAAAPEAAPPAALQLADETEPAAKQKRLSLRDRAAIARGQNTTADESNRDDEPAAPAPDGFAAALGDDAQPAASSRPRKMSLRQRIAIARGDTDENAEPDDGSVVSLDETEPDAPSPSPRPGGLAGLKAFWDEKKRIAASAKPEASAEDVKFAGADIAPPTPFERAKSRFGRGAPADAANGAAAPQPATQSRFGQLLTPMSPTELQLLSSELGSVVPIFDRFENARRASATRQQFGFLIGFIGVALFGIWVGAPYLNDTLPNVAQPHWMLKLGSSAPGGVLFGLGLLLPLLVAGVIADAVAYGWRALVERTMSSLSDIMLCGGACTIALGAFLSLQKGQVLVAAGLVFAWYVVRAASRLIFKLTARGGVR